MELTLERENKVYMHKYLTYWSNPLKTYENTEHVKGANPDERLHDEMSAAFHSLPFTTK